jgi:hypothetical protein
MAKAGKTKRGESVSAQIFLRSVSGRKLRELGQGPLPDDLETYRAPKSARDTVHRFFTDAGFKVFSDDQGLALTIEGTPAKFAEVFKTAAAHIKDVAPDKTATLKPPKEISALVDEIVVTPKPEFY